MVTNPVKISDTTFRDAHQSLIATRLRFEDMEPIASEMDSMGFYSMEVWGGATFDVTTRYLAEDPWERLRKFKTLIPNTPLTMLLRGQSLVGYRTYADDVVDAFIERSAETGIDIFRVFDALNDRRNLEHAANAVNRSGKHLQLTLCYSVTESGRLGGSIYNLDYYLDKAKQFQSMGADSICLKDMAGMLAPYDAYEIVSALKDAVDIPIQLHTHYTSGMASMSVLKAIEAGVDIVDACLAPLALRTSQPAVEPLVVTLGGTERDSGLDLQKLIAAGDKFETTLPKYKALLDTPRAAVIDAKVLSHQIPGGMASNLINQLREANAIERLDEVLDEIPRTRKELGYPPLVTPMSQMIGSQSVSNVLFGRYQMMSMQVKDYVYGLYGKPPVPVDEDIVTKALSGYERGQQPVDIRPADLIEPELDAAREAISEISTDIDDVLIYALYPTTGLRFLKIKHGLEPLPDDMKPLKEEAPKPAAPLSSEMPEKSPLARKFNVFVKGSHYEIEVDPVLRDGESSDVRRPAQPSALPRSPQRPSTPRVSAPVAPPVAPAPPTPSDPAPVQAAPALASVQGTKILAPMPGIVLRYLVKEGDTVSIGDPVLVLEAMKMENTLPAPAAGIVSSLPLDNGASVARDDVLAVIS